MELENIISNNILNIVKKLEINIQKKKSPIDDEGKIKKY